MSVLRPQINLESGMENLFEADLETSGSGCYESGSSMGGVRVFVRRPGTFIASGGYGNVGWNGGDISSFGICTSTGNTNDWRRYLNSDFTATCTPDCGIYPPSGTDEVELKIQVAPYLGIGTAGWTYLIGSSSAGPAIISGSGANPFIIGDVFDGGTHLRITGETLSHTPAAESGSDVTLTVTESWSIRFHYTDYSLPNGWPTDPEIRPHQDFSYALNLALTNGITPTGRINDLLGLYNSSLSAGLSSPHDLITYDNASAILHQPAVYTYFSTEPPMNVDPVNGWGFTCRQQIESGYADAYMLCLNGWHIQGDSADWYTDFTPDGANGAWTKQTDLLGNEWLELMTPDAAIAADSTPGATQKLKRWHQLGTPSTHPQMAVGIYRVGLMTSDELPPDSSAYPYAFVSPNDPGYGGTSGYPPHDPALTATTTAVIGNPIGPYPLGNGPGTY